MRPKPAARQDIGPNTLSLVPSAGLHAVRLLELARNAGEQGLIYLAQGQRRAEQLADALAGLSPETEVLFLPSWDCLPYDTASPSRDVMGRRMSVLRRMALPADNPRILITSPGAVVQRVPPRTIWRSSTLTLKRGDTVEQEMLERFFHRTGYIFDERVDEPGEIAIRGQVIDVYPANSEFPYRAEHDGHVILGIRRYDPVSQRTGEEADSITLEPASEVVLSDDSEASSGERAVGMEHRLSQYYPALETMFEYWPQAAIIIDEKAHDGLQNAFERISDAYDSRVNLSRGGEHAPRPENLFIAHEEWHKHLSGRHLIVIEAADEAEIEQARVPFFAGSTRSAQSLSNFIEAQEKAGRKILFIASSDGDLARIRRRLQRHQKKLSAVERWCDAAAGSAREWFSIKADIKGGFIDVDAGVAAITAYDVLGTRARGDASSEATVAAAQFTDMAFHVGDIVVHIEHGIGRLDGIEAVSIDGEEGGDAIRLGYSGEATLMVPAPEMEQIWRYGGETDKVTLDKLNSEGWMTRRRKIEAEIQETAGHLSALVESRKAVTLEALVPPGRDYERFASRFPFVETPDQARAIEEVLQDLASGHPMDRLVCGDVGFGKTEVALRAVAAAVFSGKQVAVIAPTTVLARQHLRTFQRRFAGFGIEVGHLSRLISPAEARAVKKGLADGSIQVVIGTHALAGKGVSFKHLGLVVIDEEQRFGTANKTKLRELGKDIHVLTLTATPIPRTLQSSLVGLQDISIIATPPARRQPIRTVLTTFDPATIRDALMREKRRSGQSFVVCSRVEDLEPMKAQLERLVPELELIIAHGQMPAAETDEAMVRFADGEGDVLLATSIIESGLDVPRANTMLVWRADRFGLAQLHQLRGRVGRGRLRGTMYLLTETDQELPKATEKRLRTLEALDRLGAGFAISAQDLDQRGAGSLLGEEQAGHVKLIGTDLYQHMLKRVLHGGSLEDFWTPEFNIGLTGRVPEDYVSDPETRINLYARIARLAPSESIDDLVAEIEDRFGALPQSMQNLITLAELKRLCLGLGIARIDAGPQAIAFSFRPEATGRLSINEVIDAYEGDLRWSGERLILARSIEEAEERKAHILELLERLA